MTCTLLLHTLFNEICNGYKMIWQMQQFKHAAVSLNSLQSTSQEVFKVYTVNSMVWIVQLKCNKTKFKHLQLPLLLYLSSSYVRCFLKKNKNKNKNKNRHWPASNALLRMTHLLLSGLCTPQIDQSSWQEH